MVTGRWSRVSLAVVALSLVVAAGGCVLFLDAVFGYAQCGPNGWAYVLVDGGVLLDGEQGNCACQRGVRDCQSDTEDLVCDYSHFDCEAPEDALTLCADSAAQLPARDDGGPLVYDGLYIFASDGCFRVSIHIRADSADDLWLDPGEYEVDERLVWSTADGAPSTEVSGVEVNDNYVQEELPANTRNVIFTICTGGDEEDLPVELVVQARDRQERLSNPHCAFYVVQQDPSRPIF
jgi:hypothetical protein